MAQVVWTPQALSDLEAICLFIARNSERAAEFFANDVFGATDLLVDFPQLGRSVSEVDGYRQLIVGSYRVIYRLRGEDRVEVMTIHHGARRLPDLQGNS